MTDAAKPVGTELSPESEGSPPRPGGLAVVIPAKDEAERIATTVQAALAIEGVGLVVVVAVLKNELKWLVKGFEEHGTTLKTLDERAKLLA